jgi:uncharacterized protein YbjT (DUF2867 family)
MRILATGATGTVGSEVVRQLAGSGQKVRALVHSPNKADRIKHPNIEIAYGDYARPETLRPALLGIQRAFLVCSMGPDQPKLEGNVIEEARKAGVTHVVKQSGMLAPMDQDYIVARWNRAIEKKLESSGMAWTHLRANGFMSFILSLAGTIKSEGPSISREVTVDIAWSILKTLQQSPSRRSPKTAMGEKPTPLPARRI